MTCLIDQDRRATPLRRRISIIIPTLNESAGIRACLRSLQPLRQAGHELIVVYGGSADDTLARASELADTCLTSPPGRARQMNQGAAAAGGDILLFLHADTLLPRTAADSVTAALTGDRHHWGRFDVRLSGRHPGLRLVATMMNLRSRISAIATGDQAIFVSRRAFVSVGGFPDIALMEDIALSRRLKRLGRPACLRPAVITSSRRWQDNGILPTILLMWRLRLAYYCGADPERLARRYH